MSELALLATFLYMYFVVVVVGGGEELGGRGAFGRLADSLETSLATLTQIKLHISEVKVMHPL